MTPKGPTVVGVTFEDPPTLSGKKTARILGDIDGRQSSVLILVVPAGAQALVEADIRSLCARPQSEHRDLLARLRYAPHYNQRWIEDLTPVEHQQSQLALI